MRIVDQKNIGSVGSSSGARGSSATGGARFTLHTGSAGAKLEHLAPASILGGLEALIAIKSEDGTRERKRRSVRRGQGLLDVLDELKLALLSGHLPPEMQMRLSILLREEAPSGDPRLDAIMDGIELRAAVELAKIRQARALAS